VLTVVRFIMQYGLGHRIVWYMVVKYFDGAVWVYLHRSSEDGDSMS